MSKNRKYDWEAWFGQPRVVLHRGIDYHISQSMMYQTIQNNACRRGVRVKVRDQGSCIVIEVIGHNGQLSHTGPAPAVAT